MVAGGRGRPDPKAREDLSEAAGEATGPPAQKRTAQKNKFATPTKFSAAASLWPPPRSRPKNPHSRKAIQKIGMPGKEGANGTIRLHAMKTPE